MHTVQWILIGIDSADEVYFLSFAWQIHFEDCIALDYTICVHCAPDPLTDCWPTK